MLIRHIFRCNSDAFIHTYWDNIKTDKNDQKSNHIQTKGEGERKKLYQLRELGLWGLFQKCVTIMDRDLLDLLNL